MSGAAYYGNSIRKSVSSIHWQYYARLASATATAAAAFPRKSARPPIACQVAIMFDVLQAGARSIYFLVEAYFGLGFFY